jgi:hypothetical protein
MYCETTKLDHDPLTVFIGGIPDLTDEILLPANRHINEDLATGFYVAGLAII